MAKRAGVIDQIDAQRIVIRATEDFELGDAGVDIYRMRKFQRSNQNTCINQRPLVKVGQTVAKGEVIADGPSTQIWANWRWVKTWSWRLCLGTATTTKTRS